MMRNLAGNFATPFGGREMALAPWQTCHAGRAPSDRSEPAPPRAGPTSRSEARRSRGCAAPAGPI